MKKGIEGMDIPREREDVLKSKLEVFKSLGTRENLVDLLRTLSLVSNSFSEQDTKKELEKQIRKVNKALEEFLDVGKIQIYISELHSLFSKKERLSLALDVLPRFDEKVSLWWDPNRGTIKKLSPLLNKLKGSNSAIRSLLSSQIKKHLSGMSEEVYHKVDYLFNLLNAESSQIDLLYQYVRKFISLYDHQNSFQQYVNSIEYQSRKKVQDMLNDAILKIKESSHIAVNDVHPELSILLDEGISKLVFKPKFKDKNIIWPTITNPKKHLILIPTMNRPDYLDRAINDLFENVKRYGYPIDNILLVIVDDSTDQNYQDANYKIIQKYESQNYPLVYISKDQQNNLLKRIEKYVGKGIYDYVYNKYSKKTFAGVRNLLSLFAIYYSEEDSIITYMDDDTTLKNLAHSRDQTSLEFKHLFNYFGNLDAIFNHGKVQIVGGLVTHDLFEGPIVIFHILRALRTFFYFSSGKDPQNDSIKRIRDEILGKKIIKRDMNLAMGLAWLSKFCKQARNFGAYRLPCVTYDSQKPLMDLDKPNDWLGGANVSIRYKTLINGLPYAPITWRGEDVTWSKMMGKLLGEGVYRANLPIGHIRAAGQRDIFKEFGKDLGYYASEQIIDILLPKRHMSKAAIIDGLSKTTPKSFEIVKNVFKKQDLKKDYAYFSSWPILTKETLNYMHKNEWWQNSKYRFRLIEIDKFLQTFGGHGVVDEILKHTPSPEEITTSIQNYSKLIEMWPRVVSAVEKIKEEDNIRPRI